jgi:hypothetical protein
VVSAYGTGLDVQYLCAPVCTRQSPDKTIAWTLFEEKGVIKLICWTQNGVESTIHTIQLPGEGSTQHLEAVDDAGETIIMVRDNVSIKCYQNGLKEQLWSWNMPKNSRYLQVFSSADHPSAVDPGHTGYILLLVSNGPLFYSISSAGPPTELLSTLSVPLVTFSVLVRLIVDVEIPRCIRSQILNIFSIERRETYHRN